MSDDRTRLDRLTPAQKAALARKLESARQRTSRSAGPPIVQGTRPEKPSLSYAQQRMWFLQQLDPESSAYTMSYAVRLRGPLDVEALRGAFEDVVLRHDALCSVFPAASGEPFQRFIVTPRRELAVEATSDVDAAIRELSDLRFDLENGPLFVTRLLRVGADHHVLLVAMHHIISDGWSIGVLWRDLAASYAARVQGMRASLPRLAVGYVDYAEWQRGWLAGNELERQLGYWRQCLAEVPEQVELPLKGPRPNVKTFAGDKVVATIDAELAGRIRAIARREGTTLFITLLAAFRALLARYTGQHDLAIGTAIANRNRVEVENLVGLFVNTLALRTEVRGDDSLATLIAREKATALAAYDHMEAPFAMVVEAMRVERRLDRTPLFQIAYTHDGVLEPPPALAGLTVERIDAASRTEKFDITVVSHEEGDRLRVALSYTVDLFDREMIEALAQHFIRLLDHATRDPERPLAQIDILDPAERRRILVEWNATRDDPVPARCIHELVAEHADPAAIAATDDRGSLTYGELFARARGLAARLRALGVGPETRVGVCMQRSTDLVVALLGILEAGGAYVPVDLASPAERIAYMFDDARVAAVVVDATGDSALTAGAWPRVRVTDALPPAAPVRHHPDQLAYVIYTSGSTGRPKGTGISHRMLVNLARWQQRAYALTSADRTSQVAGLAFDAAVYEIWATLLAGGALAFPSEDTRLSPGLLAEWLTRERIAVAFLPTPLAEALLLLPALPGAPLRTLTTAGDALHAVERATLPFTLINAYGPTECTVCATSATVRVGSSEAPTIGRPIDGARVYVLDAALQPVPVGVAGELYIGGRGVGRGYLDRPALTAERFVPDPFVPGARMYRTGDRVRWTPTGELAFLGRVDFQVKIRGNRIELGEIENALRAQPGAREVVVVAREIAGDKQLVAYIVPDATGLATDALGPALRATLPDYMVPAAFVVLDALPLTANGKIDRKALPVPEVALRTEFVAPRTPTEEMIARIWVELLGVPRVGIHDDFFALGGNSLKVIRLVAEIERACRVRISVRHVFGGPTIAALAAHVAATAPVEGTAVRYERTGATSERAMISQEYFYYLDRDDHDPQSYFVTAVFVIEGPLDAQLLARSYDEVVGATLIYRTAYREIDGVLHQLVRPLAESRPEPLDIVDRAPLPRDDWQAELERASADLKARDYDLAAGRGLIHTRLIRLDDTHHALMIVGHHIAVDGGAMVAFRKQLFEGYERLRAGGATALPATLPLQFIDYAVARQAWARSPAGAAQARFWADALRGAPPTELEGDFPRGPIEAHRDEATLGITADRSHPPETLVLPAPAYAAVVAAARAAQTSAFVVFMSGLAWLLHEHSRQRDITIQTTYTPRAQDPALDVVQGALTTWTVFRIDLGSATSLADAIRCTAPVVEAVHEHGPPHDFYRVVPHGLRRVVFNYIPVGAASPPIQHGDLTLTAYPWRFPPWKRPWDLHLSMLDTGTSARMVWTGFDRLFHRETLRALLDRYIAILGTTP